MENENELSESAAAPPPFPQALDRVGPARAVGRRRRVERHEADACRHERQHGAVLVPASDVQFLYDLTRARPEKPDEMIYEQRIFDEVFRIIDESRSFVVADFFLVNELMGASGAAHRPLSRELADHLIARKKAVPDLQVLLLTDPINDVYGGAPSPLSRSCARPASTWSSRTWSGCGIRIRCIRRFGARCSNGGATRRPAAA